MSFDNKMARFGLAMIEVDDLIAVLEQADMYTHWFGPSVKARTKLDEIIEKVKEIRDNGES